MIVAARDRAGEGRNHEGGRPRSSRRSARPDILERLSDLAGPEEVGAPMTIVEPLRWRDTSWSCAFGSDGTSVHDRHETRSWAVRSTSETPLVGTAPGDQRRPRHPGARGPRAILPEGLASVGRRAFRPCVGLAAVVHHGPGRDRGRSNGVTWLFDVAHNTAGVLSLARDTVPIGWNCRSPIVVARRRCSATRTGRTDAAGPRWSTLADRVRISPSRRFGSSRNGTWDPHAMARAADEVDALTVVRTGHTRFRTGRVRQGAEARGTVAGTGWCFTVGDALRILDLAPFEVG